MADRVSLVNKTSIVLLVCLSGCATASVDAPSLVRQDQKEPPQRQRVAERVCRDSIRDGKTLDEELGPGAAERTHCIQERTGVKLVMQVHRYCQDDVPDSECKRPYGIRNLRPLIDSYETLHGMDRGDYEIVVVAHGPGALHMVQGSPFQSVVEEAIAHGVRFYICQATARSLQKKGIWPEDVTSILLPGVDYVPGGLSALVDFQHRGYQYLRP